MAAKLPSWAGEWMGQWRSAGPALDAERRARLAALTHERAAAAVRSVLDLAVGAPLSPERRASSGLVEQQALFARARRGSRR